MHVLGTGVPRRFGVAGSASSPKAAQAPGCSLTPGLQISFGRVGCMAPAASVPGLCTLGFLLLCGACVWVWVVLGLRFRLRHATPDWVNGVCVCVCVRAPLVPCHSCLGCAVWVCVLGLGFRLRFAAPGCGVGACVCLCARSACTPPLLAGVCGVHECVQAWFSVAPRHSCLGFWGLCVLVCAPPLYPATPGPGVRCGCACLRSGFGWGVGVCVCLFALPTCTTPLLGRVCGLCVCAWAPVLAARRESWLGC